MSRSFSSSGSGSSGSVINESSSDALGFENIFKGGAFNKLHCTATELVSNENVISVCISGYSGIEILINVERVL